MSPSPRFQFFRGASERPLSFPAPSTARPGRGLRALGGVAAGDRIDELSRYSIPIRHPASFRPPEPTMAEPSPTEPAVAALLAVLDRAYDVQSWHGTNLRGSLRGMTTEQASRRPAPGRHNAWELVVHCAYWKYVVWRRLTAAPKGSFPLSGSDWWERPGDVTGDDADALWKSDRALLDDQHHQLRAAVADLRGEQLDEIPPGGGKLVTLELVSGVAGHDFYHAGQVQLLKRLGLSRLT